ncbi:hypothetical protein COV18_00560 [Candidatus Woesearchaeota archaeon CG10_big_fil_rev_8_21_14_0_10_37_12]|nr:MAG: hypothetical protein COV18_00560 [Candidatus Woesearchaeota archaeon CG10_big_fil_rev_8_21_14_0_10_37_12]
MAFDLLGLFKAPERLDQIDNSVSQSFAKVKNDTDTLYQWVNYLHKQNKHLIEQNAALKQLTEEQKLALHELNVVVRHLPKTAHELKQLVDSFYDFEPILRRIKHIEQKIELLEMERHRNQSFPLVDHHPSVQTIPRQTQNANQSALKERLIRKLARNSKDYVKNLVLGLVHKYGKIGALQLREMVVEEQGLCSKSSFYRILEEMEAEQLLEMISQGKHKVFVATGASVSH